MSSQFERWVRIIQEISIVFLCSYYCIVKEIQAADKEGLRRERLIEFVVYELIHRTWTDQIFDVHM